MIDTPPQPELEFPLTCHIKVISDNREGIALEIETVVRDLGFDEPVEPGRTSSSGNYLTCNVSLTIDCRETMQSLDSRLRAIEGVRFVL